MSVISMKALLESGVHFGHRTHKWNPSMKPFIFTERNGIHIIDLQKTSKALDVAYNTVRDIVAEGGTVLFVGTKRQAQETVSIESVRCGMPYVTERWLGGMLTNWRTIRGRINELERLERMRDSGNFASYTKKEALAFTRQIERLMMLLNGVRTMSRVPEAIFVVDVSRETTAVHEANLLKIPVIAMVDTNCDPRNIDYVIPSNDDAIRAIKLIVGKIADAVVEGKALRKDEDLDEYARQAVELTDELELADEDLLGASTLAKLSAQAKVGIALDEDLIDSEEEVDDIDEEVEDIHEDEEIDEEIEEESADSDHDADEEAEE
jgi:small subunit ribosomal protein S2